MPTAVQESEKTTVTTVEDRISDLPEDAIERTRELQRMRSEQEAVLAQVNGDLDLIKRELDAVLKASLEKNMTPDEKVLAGISDRYALSNEYGVGREDFDTVLDEISTNEKTISQLRRLNATGAEMTITSVTDGEIVLIDTVDNVNVEAQEEFLSGLDVSERMDAVENLQQRFPKIEQLLKRVDSEKGLNYYDYLVVCEITGAEPMSEEQYRKLQEIKPVDIQKICWLLADKARLDRGYALHGDRRDGEVSVSRNDAGYRYYVRAGRPLLRVKRKA